MANYVSKHTGAQIDAAVAAYLAGNGDTASLNLWDHSKDVVGRLDLDGSVLSTETLYKASDFIPFSTGETIRLYCKYTSESRVSLVNLSVGAGARLSLYNASKELVAHYYPATDAPIANPYSITESNVAYIRVSMAAAHLDNTDRHYGIFKEEVTLDTFDEYKEGSSDSSAEATTNLTGKSILVIGDSLSSADVWQKQLVEMGATYTNHAQGGIGLVTMVKGNDDFPALTTDDVAGKDAIILFGGTNNMRTERGTLEDAINSPAAVTSLNQWNYATTVAGNISIDGVVDTSSTDYVVTDFIPFTTGETIYVSRKKVAENVVGSVELSVGNGVALVLYDENKEFVQSFFPDSSFTLDNPYTISHEGIAYIRFRLAKTYFDNSDRQYGIFKQEVTIDNFDVYAEGGSAEGSTVAEYMRYVITQIYALLLLADNLTCRVMVVTPYCFGPSEYNEDAYAMDGIGLAQIIEDVANYYGIPVYNAYKNSGINPLTLIVWGKSDTDKLHLNDAGYAHLGRRIAHFVNENIME